jgi:ribosomal protein S15P/S13E
MEGAGKAEKAPKKRVTRAEKAGKGDEKSAEKPGKGAKKDSEKGAAGPEKPEGKKRAAPAKEKKPEKRARAKTDKPEAVVAELAKKGERPSRIGIILREKYGVGSIREATGKKMDRVLRESKLGGEIPEDLENLLKRRALLIKHNEGNRGDSTGKRGLQMVEARIIRLSNYYKRKGRIPQGWSYKDARGYR